MSRQKRYKLNQQTAFELLETREMLTASPVAPVVLSAPTAVVATATASNSVALNWTAGDTLTKGYYILRSTDNVTFTQIATVSNPKTPVYTDRAAISGTTYSYKVEEYNGTVLSSPSMAAQATTFLTTPTAFTARVTNPGAVSLSWVNKDLASTGFAVLRSDNGSAFAALTQLGALASNFIDNTISTAHTYSYKLQATGAISNSMTTTAVNAVVPLFAPTAVVANAIDNNVTVHWNDNDTNAQGYLVFRSTDGRTFTKVGSLTDASANTFIDAVPTTATTYTYEVQAISGAYTSAMSGGGRVTTAPAAPSGLTSIGISATSIVLNWADNDPGATGYNVFRATDGVHFTSIGRVNGVAGATFTDTRAVADIKYTYEVQAFVGSVVSHFANLTNVSTLVAPGSATAIWNGALVNLNWAGKDVNATGYQVLRSTDNINFTTIGQIGGVTSGSFTDSTALTGENYFYRVVAINDSASTPSASMAVATPATLDSTVSITTRFGNETIITAIGANDAISVSQTGNTLFITANNQDFAVDVPAGGLFIYTRGGSDSVSLDSSISTTATIDSIDGSATNITSSMKNALIWMDASDTLVGVGNAHSVSAFAGGVTKAFSASLANPKDMGTPVTASHSLFGTGPLATDINQGSLSDCYFLSSLAAFAQQNPSVIQNSAVDLGDGTYAVQFFSNSSPVFIRVSNVFGSGGLGGYRFAHPGATGDIWGMVMEKAFAYFRNGSNTFGSLNYGWMSEAYDALNQHSTTFMPSAATSTQLISQLSIALQQGKAITVATTGTTSDLVKGHAYTLVAINSDINGVVHFIVRNPWGVAGTKLENSQGLATLNSAQFFNDFMGGVMNS